VLHVYHHGPASISERAKSAKAYLQNSDSQKPRRAQSCTPHFATKEALTTSNAPHVAVAPAKALMYTCPMPASTVTEYLAALPADRREALNEVRRGINRALPPGYKEGIQFGMISWFVPLSTYPAGYGGNPKGPPATHSQTAALTNRSHFAKCGHDSPPRRLLETPSGGASTFDIWLANGRAVLISAFARPRVSGRCSCPGKSPDDRLAPWQHPP